jgi:hypothetical protein
MFSCGRDGIKTTLDMMGRGRMTAGAVEVEPGQIHMHIKVMIRLYKRGIKIAVLDSVTAAALEVTGTAGRP